MYVSKPSNWAQVVDEVHQTINCLGEGEYDFWVEQLLARPYFYLLAELRITRPFSLGAGGLTQK